MSDSRRIVVRPDPSRGTIEVLPATADRFADVRAILAPKNESALACWCLTYRLGNAENSRLRGEQRPQRLLELCRAEPAPGLLAYLDGTPAGWCALGPRCDFERLKRSRTIQPLDEVPVWSVVCLVVRAGLRRRGVARALIAAAVEYAARHGAPAIEAYPIETQGHLVSAQRSHSPVRHGCSPRRVSWRAPKRRPGAPARCGSSCAAALLRARIPIRGRARSAHALAADTLFP